MAELSLLVLDGWMIAIMVAAIVFIMRDFDVRKGKELAAAAIVFPPMATAIWLGAADMMRLGAGYDWPGFAWLKWVTG